MGNYASKVEEQIKQRKAADGELEGVVRARDAFLLRGHGLHALSTVVVQRYAAGCRLLDVSSNAFTVLPGAICALPELESLLAHDNALQVLPSEFGNLHNLTCLDLSRNQLSEIPARLPPGLRILRLAENELDELPGELFERCVVLESLHLAHNVIREIPPQLADVPTLEELDLAHNRLRELPPLGGLGQLRRLFLDANRMRHFPLSIVEGLNNLRVLGLSNNPFRAPLDPAIPGALPALVNLGIGGTKQLDALPLSWTGDVRLLRVPDARTAGAMEKFTVERGLVEDTDSDEMTTGSSESEGEDEEEEEEEEEVDVRAEFLRSENEGRATGKQSRGIRKKLQGVRGRRDSKTNHDRPHPGGVGWRKFRVPPPEAMDTNPDDIGAWAIGRRAGEEVEGRVLTVYQVKSRCNGSLPPDFVAARASERVAAQLRRGEKLRQARAAAVERLLNQFGNKGAQKDDAWDKAEEAQKKAAKKLQRRRDSSTSKNDQADETDEESSEASSAYDSSEEEAAAEAAAARAAADREKLLASLNADQRREIRYASECVHGYHDPLDALDEISAKHIRGSTLAPPALRDSLTGGDVIALQWRRLRCLSLAGTSISFLPDSFGGFASLHSLDLSNTPITSFPDAIFLTCPLLDTLLARNCKLTVLPPSIGAAPSLTSLDLSNNELMPNAIPDSMAFLDLLAELDLSANRQLAELPEPAVLGWVSLEVLKIGDMPDLQLPEAISKLRSLVEIHAHPTQVEKAPDKVVAFLSKAGIRVMLT